VRTPASTPPDASELGRDASPPMSRLIT
jgi:hypothetical protein